MTNIANLLIAFFFILLTSINPAWAGPGHDHGDQPAAVVGATSPRVSAHSDLFELVAKVEDGSLKIYLDRYDTNEPVTNAKIEVEVGSVKGMAVAQADGSYSFTSDVLTKPADLSVSFTIVASVHL